MSGWTEGVTAYKNKEFTVADSTTNYDVDSNEFLFTAIGTARYIQIRTDQQITVKFNTTSEDSITIEANDIWNNAPNKDRLKITNLFVTNASGSTANIKIFATP